MKQNKKKEKEKENEIPQMNYKLGDLSPEYLEYYLETFGVQKFYERYYKRKNILPEKYKKIIFEKTSFLDK